MFKKFSKGFTLLELLVVISIIGILIAMGALAYSNAQKKGRNAKRTGDMKSIQNSIEQHRANSTSYTSSTYTTCESLATAGGIQAWPSDPGSNAYTIQSCTATSYCICAQLECTSGTDCMGNSTAANCSSFATTGTNRTHFCVANQQ